MIINRKRRALGLPQKRIVIIVAPEWCGAMGRANLAAKIAREALDRKLPDAFITCNSAAPRYWVEIKTPTLKAAQEWHNAVLRLAI